jgi:hypothetical protein
MINKYTRIISFDVNYNIFTLGNCKIIILSLIKCGCIYKKKKKKIPSSYVSFQFCAVSEVYDAYRYEKPENVYTNVFYFAIKQITVWWSLQLRCPAYFIEESEH